MDASPRLRALPRYGSLAAHTVLMSALPTPASIRWNPADYAANSATQEAWGRELMDRLHLRGHERILDVGCGDGRMTAELARRVPNGLVLGVDSSPEMIRHSRESRPEVGAANLEFRELDARRLNFSAMFDLVFSNAALHWVDDHPAFLRGAARALKPGGRLVVSCGGKGNAADVFAAMRFVLRQTAWRPFFRRMQAPYFFYAPAEYRRWLAEADFFDCQVALIPKTAHYAGAAGLVAWLRTTWLPYTQRVPEARREEFIATVATRYVAKHPPDAGGQISIGMVRLEIEAVRR
jgi:trans-aconitate 2-methyltransferase